MILLAVLGLALPGASDETKLPTSVSRLATIAVTSNIEYATRGRTQLKLDVHRLRQPSGGLQPAILYIHGGAWRDGRKDQPNSTRDALVRAGFVCFSIQYRFSQQEVFPAQIIDCKAAVRWVREHAAEYGVDPNRVGVWGNSAGGHLAALLGTTGGADFCGNSPDPVAPTASDRVQAVATLFPIVDLPKILAWRRRQDGVRSDLVLSSAPENQLVGGDVFESPDLARAASPLTYIDSGDAPFLIVQGDRDEVVPQEQAEMLQESLIEHKVPCEMRIIHGMKHEMRHDIFAPYLVDYFLRTLKPGTPRPTLPSIQPSALPRQNQYDGLDPDPS